MLNLIRSIYCVYILLCNYFLQLNFVVGYDYFYLFVQLLYFLELITIFLVCVHGFFMYLSLTYFQTFPQFFVSFLIHSNTSDILPVFFFLETSLSDSSLIWIRSLGAPFTFILVNLYLSVVLSPLSPVSHAYSN